MCLALSLLKAIVNNIPLNKVHDPCEFQTYFSLYTTPSNWPHFDLSFIKTNESPLPHLQTTFAVIQCCAFTCFMKRKKSYFKKKNVNIYIHLISKKKVNMIIVIKRNCIVNRFSIFFFLIILYRNYKIHKHFIII